MRKNNDYFGYSLEFVREMCGVIFLGLPGN